MIVVCGKWTVDVCKPGHFKEENDAHQVFSFMHLWKPDVGEVFDCWFCGSASVEEWQIVSKKTSLVDLVFHFFVPPYRAYPLIPTPLEQNPALESP
jgi:hypothetical protein